jgi:hypothetical protein
LSSENFFQINLDYTNFINNYFLIILIKERCKMARKRRTTAKQRAAARRNLVKARRKWKGMSHKARKAAMPGRKRRKRR